MSSITIEARSASANITAFVSEFSQLADRVRQDPYRIGMLSSAMWAKFLSPALPVVAEFWVARRAGVVVGRIGATRSVAFPERGYIGFFEVDLGDEERDAAADALIECASAWLDAQGAKEHFAPVNVNTWFSYRFGVPHDDSLQFEWEPVQPPEYLNAFVRHGFAEVMRYSSEGFDGLPFVTPTKPSYDLALQNGYSFRPFDLEKFGSRDLEVLYAATMQCFAKNYLFEPIPVELYREVYAPALAKFDARASLFLVDPNGVEVGYLYAFVDQGHLAYKSFALLPAARGRGLSGSLLYASWLRARTFDPTVGRVIAPLVRMGAQSESYGRHAGEPVWRHEYVLLTRGSTSHPSDR